MRLSLVVLLIGLTWAFGDCTGCGTLALPMLLLATMVPLPALIYNAAATPLQLLASSIATDIARRWA